MKIFSVLFIVPFALAAGLDYSPSQAQCRLCPGSPDIYCIDLETESPVGTFIGLHVQFDPNEMNAILVNTLFNSLNDQHLVNRTDNFRKHDCPELINRQTECSTTFAGTPEQVEYSNRSFTPWDRGHIAPSHPFTYSLQGNDQTFLCLNNAPQDWFTNQQPWSRVESVVLDYFNSTKAGYVMTGLCDSDAPGIFTPTLAGYTVPSCYWKMVCYKDDAGATQVVSFIANNTITREGNDADKLARRTSTCMPRSQQDVLDNMSINRWGVVLNAWTSGEEVLLPGRNEENAPLGRDCASKMGIEESARQEWEALLATSCFPATEE